MIWSWKAARQAGQTRISLWDDNEYHRAKIRRGQYHLYMTIQTRCRSDPRKGKPLAGSWVTFDNFKAPFSAFLWTFDTHCLR